MAGLAPLLREHPGQIKDTLTWNIAKGIALTGEQIAAARLQQAEIFSRVRSFLADGRYDVLALPAVQVVPFPVEQEWVTQINGQPMATYIDWMRSCSRITVSLHPAVSVPAGLTGSGLPVGLQLVGRYGDDRRLLEIAAAIMALDEQAGQVKTPAGRARAGLGQPAGQASRTGQGSRALAARPGKASVLPRQYAARAAGPCMACAPKLRSRALATATMPR